MIILQDTREQAPFLFQGYDVTVEPATLPVGDYSLPGFQDRVAVERKALDDLIGCLTNGRDRFEKELSKGRFYEFFAVVVEASLGDMAQGHYRSEMKPHSALQSIITFKVRYRVPFIWCGNRAGAEYVTHGLLSKNLREIGETVQNSDEGPAKFRKGESGMSEKAVCELAKNSREIYRREGPGPHKEGPGGISRLMAPIQGSPGPGGRGHGKSWVA